MAETKVLKQVKNKWNRKLYNVLKFIGDSVVLQREDGSTFIINKSEYSFTYKLPKNS